MKKQLSFIAFFFVFLISGSSFADDTVYQFRLPKLDEPIYGTWINQDEKYRNLHAFEQKWIFYDWGCWEAYKKLSDVQYWRGTYILVEKWEDADTNVWYKTLWLSAGTAYQYSLARIGSDGKTLETFFSFFDFPNESDLNPSSSWYRIYHRE